MGMLTALLLSVIVDRALSATTPLLPPAIGPLGVDNSDPDTGNGGAGGGGGGGDPMSEWSSTIGIATSIIGNVLISIALNIQRYAHVRIEREFERDRQRHRLEGKKALSRFSSEVGSYNYGTLPGPSGADRVDSNGSAVNEDQRMSCNGQGSGNISKGQPDGNWSSADRIDDRLQQSVSSDRTDNSLEKSTASVDRKSYLRSPYWWVGIVLMTTGEAGNFLAYGFAPASIVSPLGVVALVSNCVIAPFMLKERFRQRDLWGVLVAVGGAVTVVLSAKTSEVKIGPGDIWGMITRWEFETYMGITVALIITLMWASEKYGRNTILIDLGLVGLFGGYTALSTKGVSSLLSFTLWHVITFPITYALVAVLIFSAMMQIRYINRALQRFDSTQVIPTQFVMFTISVILGSAILYRDFESATLDQALKFVGGCALTFLGVYLITSGRERVADGDSEEDEEEAIGLLGNEPYRDQTDWSERGRSYNRHDTNIANGKPSRSQSLLSDEVISGQYEEEDGNRTPRAQLSSSPGSLDHSISGSSSILIPQDGSPETITTNPWATSSNLGTDTEPIQGIAPSTPPQTDIYPPPTTVQLQFPSAPGLNESPTRRGLRTPPSQSPRRRSPPKTDPNHRHRLSRPSFSRAPGSLSRTPLAMRFSPGPLLAPLSGGLNAVVAESLRRGEGSPGHHGSLQGSMRRKTKGKIVQAGSSGNKDLVLDLHAGIESEYETETDNHVSELLGGGYHQAYPAAEQSTNADADAVPRVTRTASGVPHEDANYHRRMRSLSDSWTEGIARLGRQSSRRWRQIMQPDNAAPSSTAPQSVAQTAATSTAAAINDNEEDEDDSNNNPPQAPGS